MLIGGLTSASAQSPSHEAICTAAGGEWFADIGCETRAPVIDRIVVDKSERTLWAYQGDTLVRSFRVALGRDPVGPKERQGDGRTPEGVYPIVAHNPASAYHLSLRIGYPTPAQASSAREAGYSAGGDIMIHGLPNGMGAVGAAHVAQDWTEGCIALTDDEVEWLYTFTPDGAVVDIQA